MKKKLQIKVGDGFFWYEKKYKVVLDGVNVGCWKCVFKEDQDEIPYICWSLKRSDGNDIHFEEVD